MKNGEQRGDYKACSVDIHFCAGHTTDVSRGTLGMQQNFLQKNKTAIVSRGTIAVFV
ncbi:hypothetical protein [Collimonas arenae]|uniref:hypothetical protein n=1 Tax=Collimonas arenae TaxID=279058 RepID=UPI0012E053B2|nr:hypothetical protein [Collimonas arenae]